MIYSERVNHLTTTTTYSVVTGKDTFQTVYSGQKSGTGVCIVKEGDNHVAKFRVGFFKSFVDVAVGVDPLAVLLILVMTQKTS